MTADVWKPPAVLVQGGTEDEISLDLPEGRRFVVLSAGDAHLVPAEEPGSYTVQVEDLCGDGEAEDAVIVTVHVDHVAQWLALAGPAIDRIVARVRTSSVSISTQMGHA